MSEIQALTDATRQEESDAAIVEKMRAMACERLGSIKGHLWLLTPNPHFGDIAPIDLVDMGRAESALKATTLLFEGHFP